MVILAQMLNEMIASREPIIILPQAAVYGTVLLNRKVHAGFVALEICGAGEGFAAAGAGVWF